MRLEHPGTQRWQEDHRHHRGRLRGLNAAKRLANAPGVHVVLVDRRNHHLFQPLLYQVATAGLNPADIAVPIRAQFKHASNVEVHLGRSKKSISSGRSSAAAATKCRTTI